MPISRAKLSLESLTRISVLFGLREPYLAPKQDNIFANRDEAQRPMTFSIEFSILNQLINFLI